MQAAVVEDPSAQVTLRQEPQAWGLLMPSGPGRFTLQACWFARLTHDLGRADLAPLFCAADSVFFDDPRVAVGLRRDETLAAGAPRCSLRLAFKGV